MVTDTTTKEIMDLFEEYHDRKVAKKEVVSAETEKVKEAKTALADYAKKNELRLNILTKLFTDYERMLAMDNDEDDEYTELYVQIMEAVRSDKN